MLVLRFIADEAYLNRIPWKEHKLFFKMTSGKKLNEYFQTCNILNSYFKRKEYYFQQEVEEVVNYSILLY